LGLKTKSCNPSRKGEKDMTKTEKEMMNNLHDSEGIDNDEFYFINEIAEYIMYKYDDFNIREWQRLTSYYDDFFKHETISNIEDQAAMDEDNIPSKNINESVIENLKRNSDKDESEENEKINIKPPPPKYDRCDCCGRHISELTPFNKNDDPLVGECDGELLMITRRRLTAYDEKAEKAYDHVKKLMEKEGQANDCPSKWFKKIYGEELGGRYSITVEAYRQVDYVMECRDCVELDEEEYFEQIRKTYLTKDV
jgi:hypothetical protein